MPPAAAPIYWRDVISGLKGFVRGQREVDRFRDELKDFFKMEHCFLVSSGKAALTITLSALRDLHPHREEVLIPAFTCYSVPSAITRAGLTVRLCDIDPDTMDFDYDRLAETLSNRTTNSAPQCPKAGSRLLAAVPTHLFGLPANVPKLRELIHDPGVIIIEDAAQAMGGYLKGRKLGTLGDVSFFSLGRGKSISTAGGGVILTDRDDIAAKIEKRVLALGSDGVFNSIALVLIAAILALFTNPYLFWLPKSLKFLRLGETIYDPHFRIKRISCFQAGLARGWNKKLAKFAASRAQNSNYWRSVLRTDSFELYSQDSGNPAGPIRFPLRVNDPDQRAWILKESVQMGLGIMQSYPDSIDAINQLELRKGDFPEAGKLARDLITLPVHPFVTQKDRDRIIDCIAPFLASKHKISACT